MSCEPYNGSESLTLTARRGRRQSKIKMFKTYDTCDGFYRGGNLNEIKKC